MSVSFIGGKIEKVEGFRLGIESRGLFGVVATWLPLEGCFAGMVQTVESLLRTLDCHVPTPL